MTGSNGGRPGAEARSLAPSQTVTIRTVPFDRPWEWLRSGWNDLWNRPGVSLAYGFFATACGLLLTLGLVQLDLGSLMPVLAGGFLLVGPLLAVGLYEKSRVIAEGRPATLSGSIAAATGAMLRFSLMAAFLLFLYLVWLRIAVMLTALFLSTQGLPPARELMPMLLFTSSGLGLLIVGTAAGAILAAVAFATTAISIPMLMDRRVDAVTAMAKSIEAVLTSPKPMALWAALIAGFIALGIATVGVGLVVAFPLIGHATWHAYCDLTGRGDG